MNSTRADKTEILKVVGAIHQVDTSSRDLTLFVDGIQRRLVVPPDCLIRLNGERVKLRLLQPGDQAEVAFSFLGNMAFAHSIQVHWLPRAAPASRAPDKRDGSCPDPAAPPQQQGESP